jgi:Transposase DDE domain group 1
MVLDMDSTKLPVYGQQEYNAYEGYFESTCYHPFLLFKRKGDCLAAKLRPGSIQSAEVIPLNLNQTTVDRRAHAPSARADGIGSDDR